MGESIYRFALRELPGGIRRAWQLERERLAHEGRSAFSWHNTMLQSYAVTARAADRADRRVRLGDGAVPGRAQRGRLVAADVGQLRRALRPVARRLPNGQYEAPQPHHSWNTNHLITNLALFHLQRHSDHHAYPSRRYQSLRHFEKLPQLPSGYFGMFPLSYVPSLWFKVMDPRLLALPHVAGDLNRINIDPRHRDEIVARYGARAQRAGGLSATPAPALPPRRRLARAAGVENSASSGPTRPPAPCGRLRRNNGRHSDALLDANPRCRLHADRTDGGARRRGDPGHVGAAERAGAVRAAAGGRLRDADQRGQGRGERQVDGGAKTAAGQRRGRAARGRQAGRQLRHFGDRRRRCACTCGSATRPTVRSTARR